jgi:membrane-associated protein
VIVDLFLHLDRHLVELLMRYDQWIYVILFAIIFAETGFVVTPFLPGDSLLFGVGALAAVDRSGTLNVAWLLLLLAAAAIAGNSLNYGVGRRLGQRAFSGRYRFFKLAHLQRTQAYFVRHGGLAVLLSRFMPIVRTFVPFVAGAGQMPSHSFALYNLVGAVAWVSLCLGAGVLFGNVPIVKQNFSLVSIGIVCVSLLPVLVEYVRRRDPVSPRRP